MYARIEAEERAKLPVKNEPHAFQNSGGGTRKDTSIVVPGRTLTVDIDADNPGRRLPYCHDPYHGEAEMMGVHAYPK
ncbi:MULTISPECIES: multicopper oxidase domain-containing protein [unclassified Cryobacterium]|uniref:multicopper oxidase domain-containing protein n=1 Tax=unclassified Cryobacterium TaxID=2649013 RepID=UPI00106C2955|nr:hypothetical protein E3T29_13150 [Cryobacterium sp. TMT1-66-1]TFD08999.1 hypothetical protein E3T35_15345 [Cryobacterium sp. TMT1-2-2]